MARKVVNRKELRREGEAAEKSDGAERPAKKAKAKTPAKPRKSRAKSSKGVRRKAFWGIFNQSMKRVAVFEYSQRDKAQQKAEELSTSQRTPHFVQIVKEDIDD